MKKRLVQFVEKVHLKVFGHEMGDEMRSFLTRLSWSFLSGIGALPILMLITTLAGRFMGPIEYGKYNLMLVANQYLIIFIFLGLDTVLIRSIARDPSVKARKRVISSISNIVFLVLVGLVVLSPIVYPFVSRIMSGGKSFFLMLICYTIVFSAKTLFDSSIRGLEEFKVQAKAKIFEVIIVAVLFIAVFFVLKDHTFAGFVSVLVAGAIAISIYYLSYLKRYFGKSNFTDSLAVLREGKWFLISALLGTIFLSADKIIIAKYLGFTAFGIYSAYYFSSFTLIAQAGQLFNNVFFPATVRVKDKAFIKKIDKIFCIGFLPLFVLASCLTLIMLSIFGRQYPVSLFYVIGFSVLSVVFLFQSIYATIILDFSEQYYRKCLLTTYGVNFLAICLYIVAVRFSFFSVSLVIGTLIANYCITIAIQRFYIKKVMSE
ncbi:MAG: lipopolysaccharide biosynthesis protein [Patescibacteria group bacterium]|jgi:O-antigen/teichoic acid export membrane protein